MGDNGRDTTINHMIYAHLRKPGTPPVEQIADDLGMSSVTLYKISEGERDLRLPDFPRFYRFSGKPIEILKYIVSRCDPTFALVRIGQTNEINGDFTDEKDGLVVVLGQTIETLNTALDDDIIDRSERQKIVDKCVEMIAICNRLIAETNAKAAQTGVRSYPGGAHVRSVPK